MPTNCSIYTLRKRSFDLNHWTDSWVCAIICTSFNRIKRFAQWIYANSELNWFPQLKRLHPSRKSSILPKIANNYGNCSFSLLDGSPSRILQRIIYTMLPIIPLHISANLFTRMALCNFWLRAFFAIFDAKRLAFFEWFRYNLYPRHAFLYLFIFFRFACTRTDRHSSKYICN